MNTPMKANKEHWLSLDKVPLVRMAVDAHATLRHNLASHAGAQVCLDAIQSVEAHLHQEYNI